MKPSVKDNLKRNLHQDTISKTSTDSDTHSFINLETISKTGAKGGTGHKGKLTQQANIRKYPLKNTACKFPIS